MNKIDVEDIVFHRYLANHQVLLLVSDETFRIQTQVQEAAKRLNKERKEDVTVVMHDKVSGFYTDNPGMVPPKDKTNMALLAMQMMTLDHMGLKEAGLPTEKLKFDIKQNVIFLLKDWEVALQNDLLTIQAIRNMVQSNLGSGHALWDNNRDEATRGKRMLIFLQSSEDVSKNLPELKPDIIPLPDDTVLGQAVDKVLAPLVEANKADSKKGVKAPDAKTRQQLVTALQGSTYQFAEDTFSFALVKHRGLGDMTNVLKSIENEKSRYIAGIPGLMYISKENLTPVDQLPGYEPAVEFVRECMAIDPADALKHRVKPLRGITLAGAPGTGKTQFGMAVAQEANRILLLWSPGESQGSLVGESEMHTRRVMQIAQAMRAVVLVDDVDKAGVSVATGGSTASVEGGPFGRMIQMLLTEMSSDDNQAIWVFTANRIKNLPPELIRPGRMDERFFIQRPDEDSRERIARVHILKRGFNAPNDQVGLLSDSNLTDGWTGAEIEALIAKAVRRALRNKQKELDWKWMFNVAKETTPMIKQKAYADDIKEMEEFCDTWTRCGRKPEIKTKDLMGGGRAARSASI